MIQATCFATQTLTQATPVAVSLFSTVLTKIIDFVKTYFNAMQWSFLYLYGTKEILFDNVYKKESRGILPTYKDRLNQAINKVFVKNDNVIGNIKFNMAHGTLYTASGVIGFVPALQRLGYLDIGAGLIVPLEALGNVVFGFASLVALIQNIKLYKAASKMAKSDSLPEQEAAQMIKKSAVMGIISSLSYILTAITLIFSASTAIAFLFGIIAVITGCLKILYDFFRFRQAF